MFVSIMAFLVLTAVALIVLFILAIPLILLTWLVAATLDIASDLLANDTDIP